MQSIDLHVQQVNEDRYVSLGKSAFVLLCPLDSEMSPGTFLLNNYKQALDVRRNFSQELKIFTASTGFTTDDFVRWHKEETTFLSVAKRKEPEELTLKVSYVEDLEKYFTTE